MAFDVNGPRYPWEDAAVKYHSAHNLSVKDLWVDKPLHEASLRLHGA